MIELPNSTDSLPILLFIIILKLTIFFNILKLKPNFILEIGLMLKFILLVHAKSKFWISFWGEEPKKRLYSRLNCDALS